MDKKMEEDMKKRVKSGWIRSSVMVEAMAINEKAAKGALEKLIESLSSEENIMVYNKEFHEAQKVKKPLPNVEEASSVIVEFDMLTINYDRLLYVVLNYGPSSIEILEPEHIKMDAGEAQNIANSLAAMIHKIASSQIGGMLMPTS
ncbi:MAG: hypothetical protein JW754_03045 [Candidatus Aenigmarchaeota archaeon]|nr:hypothetical protein [Candidatus Aenigmarchaeota archaeon]